MPITGRVYGRLLEMTKEGAIHLLIAALDEMQRYNGQSKTSAIMRAAGAEETENGWVMPLKDKMEKEWAENYPILD